MKTYDLSQDLNQEVTFWPYYPPFEVKYIKRKAEHGVNAQYIQTSNHMGTHLDAPRHFVTNGRTIDQIPMEWLCGPGVIVDLRDEMGDLAVYTPKMIEKRVKVKEGDILILHTGWHKHYEGQPQQDLVRYFCYHPGPSLATLDWMLKKKIKWWAMDTGSCDHAMNTSIRYMRPDLAEEFTKMIVTQRAYSANAKVINTTDQMLDELIRMTS